ncbi:MAG: CoA transferase [Candidatus Hydrogenedentes bacterium]|nr:CoA transferase [Candidatus Hydrogenedentota bacterium]
MKPLAGLTVVSLAINAPGPVAAARLRDYGARVIKIEPPEGDPLNHLGTGWYSELSADMDVRTINLKDPAGRAQLDDTLEHADLLLTAQRPSKLAKLGLSWPALHARFPRLCWVAIVGYPPPNEDVPGHDLNYQAYYGTLTPPQMPRVLVADMAGAERATTAATALLIGRERGREAGFEYVALSEAAEAFSKTVAYNITVEGGVLGGGLPNYRIYETKSGYLAVGALEFHFFHGLMRALDLTPDDTDKLGEIFLTRSAAEWETWAEEFDLPLKAIKGT